MQDVLRFDHDLHGVDALFVVATHGGSDDHKGGVLDGVNAEGLVVAEHEGTQIKRGALLVRSPILLALDKVKKHLHSKILGDLGQTKPFRRVVHPADVLNGTEKLDFTIRATVRLETFKDLGAIVERGTGGMDRKVLKRNDASVVPALVGGVVHDEHMIGKILAETESVLRRHGLRIRGFNKFDFHNFSL